MKRNSYFSLLALIFLIPACGFWNRRRCCYPVARPVCCATQAPAPACCPSANSCAPSVEAYNEEVVQAQAPEQYMSEIQPTQAQPAEEPYADEEYDLEEDDQDVKGLEQQPSDVEAK